MNSEHPSLDAVVAVVHRAGQVALELGPRRPVLKSDGSWVTEADLAVSKVLQEALSQLLPSASHLDEEHGGQVGPGLAWVVDPIDGTTNFKRGDDRWCVSVALLSEGVPVLGVIHQPTLGRTWAADGCGPQFPADGPGDAGVLIGGRVPFSVPRWYRMLRETRGARSLRISGSAALDFVDVACGRAERVMALGVGLWDYAAGMVLVQSMGGHVQRWPAGSRWDVVAHHRPLTAQ